MNEWGNEYRELQIYIDNEYDLYQQKQSIEKNLQCKIKAGKYDSSLAPKLWLYLVDAGARKYCKEFSCQIRDTFPKRAVREPLAAEYARDWEYENKIANPRTAHSRANPMTKAQAWADFQDMILPEIEAQEAKGAWGIDGPMRCEAWNNYTDMLCKDGMITMKQYETWTHPVGLKTNPKHTRPEKPRKKKRTSTRKRPYSRGRLGGGSRKNPISVRKLVSQALK